MLPVFFLLLVIDSFNMCKALLIAINSNQLLPVCISFRGNIPSLKRRYEHTRLSLNPFIAPTTYFVYHNWLQYADKAFITEKRVHNIQSYIWKQNRWYIDQFNRNLNKDNWSFIHSFIHRSTHLWACVCGLG